jgi:hypothetical protein
VPERKKAIDIAKQYLDHKKTKAEKEDWDEAAMTDDLLPIDDPDLQYILSRRIFIRLESFKVLIPDFKIKIDDSSNTDVWLPYFQKITQDEVLTKFEAEVNRYEKKFNRKDKSKEPKGWPHSQYARDIDEARAGKEKKMIRLIQWDRAWLLMNWVIRRILDAQESGNLNFLRNIGEAISKEPGCIVYSKSIGGKLIIRLSGVVIAYYKTQYPRVEIREALKSLHNQLRNNWLKKHANDSPEMPLLYDRDYFFKFLKRHGVIGTDTKI